MAAEVAACGDGGCVSKRCARKVKDKERARARATRNKHPTSDAEHPLVVCTYTHTYTYTHDRGVAVLCPLVDDASPSSTEQIEVELEGLGGYHRQRSERHQRRGRRVVGRAGAIQLLNEHAVEVHAESTCKAGGDQKGPNQKWVSLLDRWERHALRATAGPGNDRNARQTRRKTWKIPPGGHHGGTGRGGGRAGAHPRWRGRADRPCRPSHSTRRPSHPRSQRWPKEGGGSSGARRGESVCLSPDCSFELSPSAAEGA